MDGDKAMRTIIIYNSKSGFTKRYAYWISEEIDCTIQPYRDFSKSIIDSNDIIIFGSRVHAGKIEYLNRFKSYFNDQSIKKLIVFVTGATPIAAEDAIKKIWANNFSEIEVKSVPHFYMQSGLNYEEMGFVDRTIMKTVSKLMSGKKDKNDEEAGFEQAIGNSHDISSKKYIAPLVNFIKDKLDK